MLQLWTYLVYAVIAVGLTVWLAGTLFRNGALFLEDVFEDKPQMAQAVNHLLVVGFYMLNLGWAFLILRTDRPDDGVEAVENLATKLGLLLLTLGVVHFTNLWAFQRIRRGRRGESVPPVQAICAAFGPPPYQPSPQPFLHPGAQPGAQPVGPSGRWDGQGHGSVGPHAPR